VGFGFAQRESVPIDGDKVSRQVVHQGNLETFGKVTIQVYFDYKKKS